MDKLMNTCETCKQWGGQGCNGLRKTLEGDWRTCMCAMFGDFYKETKPMFKWEVTWELRPGMGECTKGGHLTHREFGCINHNPEFEPQPPNE